MASVQGTDKADYLHGTAGNDTIEGAGGNDRIYASAGDDSLDGGNGHNRLDIDVGDATLYSAAPTGTVFFTVSGSRATSSDGVLDSSLSNFSFLTFSDHTGDNTSLDASGVPMGAIIDVAGGDHVIIGTADGDEITAGSGTNTIDGGAGDDYLTLTFDNEKGAVVCDQSGDTLRLTQAGRVLDTITSVTYYNISGGQDDISSAGTNIDASRLTSGVGLYASAGADVIVGGSGDDFIHLENLGETDRLSGGGGRNSFIIDALPGANARADTLGTGTHITDFSSADTIDYTSAAAGYFIYFDGTAAFSGQGAPEIRYEFKNGETLVEFDSNGDGRADDLITLTNGEFVLHETFLHSNVLIAEPQGTAGADSLTGTAGDDAINGLAGDDQLSGLGGDDTLDGGLGHDTLIGGLGNDTYVVDSAHDKIVENANEGLDTVIAAVGWTLGDALENLTLSGTRGNTGTGNALDNHIIGNAGDNMLVGLAGNDVLDGGLGHDTLVGGTGNDLYVVDSGHDTVVEKAGEGNDTVVAAVSWTLGDNLENLTLSGTHGNSGTGNALDNTLIGNSGDNHLSGMAGNDTMVGGDGNDVLLGGAGRDVMTGGASNDHFVFAALSDFASAKGGSADEITDFATGDKIDLSSIDAIPGGGHDTFGWLGTAAFDGHAGELRFYEQAGATYIQADLNGDKVTDFAIKLDGVHALTAADFAL